ncbi:hypothetical protein [Lichenicoccus roseus]|uniref:Uncharacterized protein n=1 Tax=Lichenicoccus roseus TaxID=2683649 RepID=A0A5R9J5T4_9PROT|nr:hypothetical protein [Lichenicoccus roseus]TLU72213.1 hypothetical protein FE263_13980 [Lichenicoccus roseus]
MQSFFRCPRKRFDGTSWTITIGFRKVAGPIRFGDDADYLIARLTPLAARTSLFRLLQGREVQAA